MSLYLQNTLATSLERLCGLIGEVFGRQISEGDLVSLFRRALERVAKQTAAALERVMASPEVCSEEPSARVAGRTWWECVVAGAVLQELAASSAKSGPEWAMAGARAELSAANLSCNLICFVRSGPHCA